MEIQQALYPNITVFIQAFLFLIFLFIIRQILVKPYSAVIEERESIIAKNYEEAKKLQEEASKFLELAKEELEKASLTSKEILNSAKRGVEKIKAERLAQVEKEAQEEIERAVEEIRRKLEEEKQKLQERIKDIAEEIVKKIEEEAA
jgi:F-type H+-transporting ATPase subunit b